MEDLKLIAKLQEENAKLKHLVSEMCTVIETDEPDVDNILDRAYEALGSSRVHEEIELVEFEAGRLNAEADGLRGGPLK